MDKEIEDLLNKCNNCKLKECIACEFTYTDIQKIKKYVEELESILDKVTDTLKEVYNKYIKEYKDVEKLDLIEGNTAVLQELSCVIEDIEEILNIIEGEKK